MRKIKKLIFEHTEILKSSAALVKSQSRCPIVQDVKEFRFFNGSMYETVNNLTCKIKLLCEFPYLHDIYNI